MLTRRSFLKALFSMSVAGALPVTFAQSVETELASGNLQVVKPVEVNLIDDGKWHHIMLVRANGNSQLYFDNREVDQIEGLSVVTTEGKIFLETDSGTIIGMSQSSVANKTSFTFSSWIKMPKSQSACISDVSLVAA